MALPKEVFLSHSSVDATKAIAIADMLRRHQVPVWFAPANIAGAAQWQDEIGAALRRCDWFLLLLSPGAVASVWVKRELQYALGRRQYDQRIIPLVLQTCDVDSLNWVLSSIQMIDGTGTPESGYRALLNTWDIDYHPAV